MAMTMKTEGLDALGQQLAKLGEQARDIASGALYDGAGVMADAVNAGIGKIRTAPFKYATGNEKRLPSPQEKAALKRKAGIAKFRKDTDGVDTLVGLAKSGYTQVAGKRKPVAVIARSINSGTSFMQKQPVIRQAVTGAKASAEAAIISKAETMIEEITK